MMKLVNLKRIAIMALSTAVLVSIISVIYLAKNKLYNAEQLLTEVKTYFRDVKGSYIVQQPIILNQINNNQPIYQGGITTYKNGKLIDYEFYADAYSGQVIDIIEL
ncbi:peptidase propeptide and YPEB domain-containing protein [Staphylococcus saccharolyticus]|uniref:Peptidase propeptide and YPEB domain-containing protein n=2 Tax=Staphylococcus saccharolyticus TaxID=33028 RepID=A0A380H3W8_9STAP|nr:peptidase propeptide and YPEB domain-containing protein [Staphylococcus saccharolyticus]